VEGSFDLKQVRIGVVADDLTGALDTAGAFASRGLRCRILTAPADMIDPRYDGDVVCANTQTRNVDAALAIAPVYRTGKELFDAGYSRLFKKVDSTARGNLAAECRAVMDAQESEVAIVCPTFPPMGRTVIEGVLMVDGTPVTWTTEGTDDLAPVSSDSLVELMFLKGKLTPGLVPLSVVRLGADAIQAKVNGLVDQEHNAIVVDAENESDLQAIANYSMDHPDYLLVGSAGLAYAVAELVGGNSDPIATRTGTDSPVVIIAGSRHEATRGQLGAISDAGMAEVISMKPKPVLGERMERVGYSREVMAEIQRILSAGQNVVLAWEDQTSNVEESETSVEDGTMLANFAGLLVYGIARRTALGGLIIAGGDTAFGVLRALGASIVDVEGQVEDGVPIGVIGDGIGEGLTVVTKAGGFGDEGLFIRALEVIREPSDSKN
jgi:uncharacterized protein YgbK (DUF1537 family)